MMSTFCPHVVGCFACFNDKTAQVEQRCGLVQAPAWNVMSMLLKPPVYVRGPGSRAKRDVRSPCQLNLRVLVKMSASAP